MSSLKDYIERVFSKVYSNRRVLFSKDLFIEINQDFLGDTVNEICDVPDPALNRPFRVLVEGGKRVGTINNLFYKSKNDSSAYVVGSICYTSARRVLFFPGLLGRRMLWHSKMIDLPIEGHVDHFTVEPDLKTWHYTVLHNGKKQDRWLLNNDLIEVFPGLYCWFGMSLRSISSLEPLYRRYNLKLSVSEDDFDRYSDIVMKAKKSSVNQMALQVAEDAGMEEFTHFDFLIDLRPEKDAVNMPSNVSMVPTKPPALQENIEDRVKSFPMRIHSIAIPEFAGRIVMLASKHKGTLKEDVLLSSK